MACTSSILHLLMMSGDRYLAICRPLVHRTLPRHIVYIALAVSWIVPCFINCMLNPILYYRCNTSVKQAVKQLMNKCHY
ncbi:trace amine-associated receptor 4-like [Patella vulgata]|uniref:trace amine-associated receptor 4-like n=1 Tax=Patella vulgata TaxID=6465 RepID=UPI0024A9F308|nr:trace amine-associated receptor 4-like [Patella vulgata]